MTSTIAYTAGILSFTAGCIIFFIFVMIFIKYRLNKQRATLFLAISVLTWTLTSWFASGVYFLAYDYENIAHILQNFMYSSVFLGSMGIFFFAANVFFKSKKSWNLIYVLIGIIFILIISLTNSSDPIPFPDTTELDPHYAFILKTEYSILLVIYLLPTFFGTCFISFRTGIRADGTNKVRFYMLGIGLVSVVGVFVCDTIAGLFLEDPMFYAIFLYAQWIFAIISAFTMYLGWIMPGWFKKLVK